MARINPNLKSFEDLFKPSEELEKEKAIEKTIKSFSSISLSKLKAFDKHPFKMYNNEKMQSLADSIKEYGVITPILVRPIKHEKYEYEIIAGHNRVQGARMAGLDEIPCDIREMDDETSIILMVDTNLQQRESILPSEKAFAYKYKLEAIKAQGKRNDLTCAQIGHKLNARKSVEKVAANSDDSRNQIKRYICLTKIIPDLLDKVDEKRLSFIPAVELSYLNEQEQDYLHDILNREENFSVPLKQATMLKGISQNGELTYEKIDKIITQKIQQPSKTIKLSYKKIKEYIPDGATPKEFEDIVVRALKAWFEQSQEDDFAFEP